jgi:hypothetical protein
MFGQAGAETPKIEIKQSDETCSGQWRRLLPKRRSHNNFTITNPALGIATSTILKRLRIPSVSYLSGTKQAMKGYATRNLQDSRCGILHRPILHRTTLHAVTGDIEHRYC